MKRPLEPSSCTPLYPAFAAALSQIAEESAGDAKVAGAAAGARTFLQENREDVEKALSPFAADGTMQDGSQPPASAYNDFYKWTMLPVMRVMHRAYPDGVMCTFSANIRDAAYRKALTDSATGKTSPDLIDSLRAALEAFANRAFDRHLYESAAKEFGLPAWDEDTLNTVCGPQGRPRALAQTVVSDLSMKQPLLPEDANSVQIQIFVAPDLKIEDPERVYIEATGPWQLVTWLETSMMQAIYEVLFRDRMRKRYRADDMTWYPKWLASAFVRTALSEEAARDSGLKGMIMTGRRTGGLPLMFLQSIYLQSKLRNADGELLLLGQSSVTAYYWLLRQGVTPSLVPKPAGTHAHELSMVLSAILGDVDSAAGVPLSQAIGHAIYFFASLPQGDVQEPSRKKLMPMLPDTLGSETFMKVASQLVIPRGPHKGAPFLSVVGAARQDSGTLEDFQNIMAKYGFSGACVASEIEVAKDLFEAKRCGYVIFGAGGFFGDSEKAWVQDASNISMAIKVLRVYIGGVRTKMHPAKTGDSGGGGEGKFEADGLLPEKELQALKEQVKLLQQGAVSATLQQSFDKELARLLGPE